MEGKNLYVLIYNYLLTRIYYGFYPKGEYLPSIHKLSDLFGVSTMAVRGALRLLRENGYLSGRNDGWSVVLYDHEHPKRKFPEHILVPEAALEEVHQILDRAMAAWEAPTVDFLTHVAKCLHNSLLLDLYYDVMLFCYPAYLARIAEDRERWEKNSGLLPEKLREILRLKERGNRAALWDIIKRINPSFTPMSISNHQAESESHCQWGKPQICLSTASKLVTRIYYVQYPVDTFLPSARVLSNELSVAVITVRRSIVLLNDLGVAESVNGKGTKVLSPERGIQRVKWDGNQEKH